MAVSIHASINRIFNEIESYNTNGSTMDINHDESELVASCLQNYYKIKISTLMGMLIKPDDRLNTLTKLLVDTMNKIMRLPLDKIHISAILGAIAEQNILVATMINDDIIKQLSDKNIYTIWSYCKKIGDLEKCIIQMMPSVTLELVKPYERILVDKVYGLFEEFSEKIKKVILEETHDTKDKTVLGSYAELCNIIKIINDQVIFINNEAVKLAIRRGFTGMYEKYLPVVDKNEPSNDQIYVIMNTIQKICDSIDNMNLKCVEIKSSYNEIMTKLLMKIVNQYSKSFNTIIKINIKHKNTDIDNSEIIKTFYDARRTFLDVKINNLIFKKMVDKIVYELTTAFVQNSDNGSLTDKMIINFDVILSEMYSALLGIAKMADFESAFVTHAFKKIKLIKNYYSYSGIDDEALKSEFMTEYGNLELYEQLKINKSKKKISFGKISNAATSGIAKGLHFLKLK